MGKIVVFTLFSYFNLIASWLHGFPSRNNEKIYSSSYAGFNKSSLNFLVPDNFELVSGSRYGKSVAIFNKMALVSATNILIANDEKIVTADSAVFVFEESIDSTWSQYGNILTSGSGVLSDGFGEALAINDNIAVVGAWKDSSLGTSSGKAYVFFKNESISNLKFGGRQTLLPQDQSAGDYFGYSCAISTGYKYFSDGVIIIGSYGYDYDNKNANIGAIFLFASYNQRWKEILMLTPADPIVYASFGWSLATYGDILVVGAPSATDSSSGGGGGGGNAWTTTGSAYVINIIPTYTVVEICPDADCSTEIVDGYRYHITTSWSTRNLIKLTGMSNSGEKQGNNNNNNRDYFGDSVAVYKDVSGNGDETVLVAVGASQDDQSGTDSGAVYMFRWFNPFSTSSTTYRNRYLQSLSDSQNRKSNNNNNNDNQENGREHVILNNNNNIELTVGTKPITTNRQLQKQDQAAAAATQDSGDEWVLAKKLMGVTGSQFGSCIGLYANYLLIGADYGGYSSGNAFIYDSDEYYKITALRSPGLKGDYFGSTCGIFGYTALVGAYQSVSVGDGEFGEGGTGVVASYSAFGGQWIRVANSFSMFSVGDIVMIMSSVAVASVLIALVIVFVVVKTVYYAYYSSGNKQHEEEERVSYFDESARSFDALNPTSTSASPNANVHYRDREQDIISRENNRITTTSRIGQSRASKFGSLGFGALASNSVSSSAIPQNDYSSSGPFAESASVYQTSNPAQQDQPRRAGWFSRATGSSNAPRSSSPVRPPRSGIELMDQNRSMQDTYNPAPYSQPPHVPGGYDPSYPPQGNNYPAPPGSMNTSQSAYSYYQPTAPAPPLSQEYSHQPNIGSLNRYGNPPVPHPAYAAQPYGPSSSSSSSSYGNANKPYSQARPSYSSARPSGNALPFNAGLPNRGNAPPPPPPYSEAPPPYAPSSAISAAASPYGKGRETFPRQQQQSRDAPPQDPSMKALYMLAQYANEDQYK